MTDVKRIETYSLYEFCQEVQTAIQDGYTFDFESNENFPTAFGSLLVCGLTKAVKKVEEKVEAKTETEVETDAQTDETDEVVQDEVQTEVAETAEVAEVAEVPESAPAKRGPKPKAK
jgi:hypothetical protein